MRIHLYYYLTLALALLLGGTVIMVIFSEEILMRDHFKRQASTEKTAPIANTAATATLDSIKQPIYGIDVSHYQGDLPWKNLSNSLKFAICKATEGRTLLDSEFKNNWSNIKSSGRVRGAYHFYLTSDPPENQALFFWETVGKLDAKDLPLILDIEKGSMRKELSPSELERDLLIFLSTLERLSNKTPIIYSNTYFANQYLNSTSLSAYPLWVAEYSKSKKQPQLPKTWSNSKWLFWQKSPSYDLRAVGEDVDFDLYNGTEKDLIQFIGQSSVAQ